MEALPVFPKFKLPLAAVAIAVAAAPASAANVQDVRCFLLSSVFAQKADKDEGRKLAQATGLFYIGKLQGTADADLRRVIAQQQAVNIAPAAATAEMQKCAMAVQTSLQRLQALTPRQVPPAPPKK